MADCGDCAACCGDLVSESAGSYLIEDFCPQEWESLSIAGEHEKVLWKKDPLSLGNAETVEIDLSKPRKVVP